MLIFGDLVVFAFVFGAYLAQRLGHRSVFLVGQQLLDRNLAFGNTLLLLTGSVLVVRGLRAVRAGRPDRSSWCFAGALACGLGFVAVKVVEYHHLVSTGHGPSSSTFFTYYFVLTGLHLFHVVVGLAALTFLVVASRRPTTPRRRAYLESAACFWHLVDLLWIVLFPLLYLLR